MSYYPKKTDANQQEIMDALRECGYTVVDTHTLGRGFPDIVVGAPGLNVLMEVKTEKGKLNEKEKEFFDLWAGPIAVVRDADGAISVMQTMSELQRIRDFT